MSAVMKQVWCLVAVSLVAVAAAAYAQEDEEEAGGSGTAAAPAGPTTLPPVTIVLPTVSIVTPAAGGKVAADKKYEVAVRITGPKNGEGTVTLEFHPTGKKETHQVLLDESGSGEFGYMVGPDLPGGFAVFASATFDEISSGEPVVVRYRVVR